MNKAELIDAMASEAKITKADAGRALQAFMTVTSKTLKKGERVALVGFGTFSITYKSKRGGAIVRVTVAIHKPASRLRLLLKKWLSSKLVLNFLLVLSNSQHKRIKKPRFGGVFLWIKFLLKQQSKMESVHKASFNFILL